MLIKYFVFGYKIIVKPNIFLYLLDNTCINYKVPIFEGWNYYLYNYAKRQTQVLNLHYTTVTTIVNIFLLNYYV